MNILLGKTQLCVIILVLQALDQTSVAPWISRYVFGNKEIVRTFIRYVASIVQAKAS